uniref:Uncharacterized protein n=1 Tax=Anguilla anguilla TaxID=7936 RepID=A0A0E9QAN0_ANGAN
MYIFPQLHAFSMDLLRSRLNTSENIRDRLISADINAMNYEQNS